MCAATQCVQVSGRVTVWTAEGTEAGATAVSGQIDSRLCESAGLEVCWQAAWLQCE